SCALVGICAFAATTTMTDTPAMTNLLALPMPTPFMLFITCSSSTRDVIGFAKSFVQQWIKLGPDFIFFSAALMAEGTFGLCFHFRSWRFGLMMIEIVVAPSSGIGVSLGILDGDIS